MCAGCSGLLVAMPTRRFAILCPLRRAIPLLRPGLQEIRKNRRFKALRESIFMIEAIAFYLLSAVLLLSAVMVVGVRSPVHAVLFLILSFFNAAGLFILLGAELLAFLLVIVYVGAVAVLFLFVVMMLDIGPAALRREAMRYIPVGLALGAVLLFELFFVYAALPQRGATPDPAQGVTNVEALGRLLYTTYFLPFQVSGLILLVAMIGAIVLTHRVRPDTRRQKVSAQVARQPSEVVHTVRVTPGSGI